MNAALPAVEMWVYSLTWLCGVSYSIYSVYLSGRDLWLHGQQEFFSSGWSVLMSSKDTSDYEWAIWTDFLYKASFWFLCNSIGAEIIRWMYKQAIPVWYLFVSLWFLAINLGVWPTLFIFAVPCVIYILSERKNVYLIWGLVLIGMLVLSFGQIKEPFVPWNRQRCLPIGLNCLRFLGWWLFTEVALHFIYSSALVMHPQIVEHLGAWSLYGMGYCMGQLFMLKYVVIYGLMSTVAHAEHIAAPHHPKCIAHIYLYSDMWRYFDQGLYLFLKRCIYVPCLGKNPGLWRKLMSSFVCFGFIFLWHKPYMSIFVWSFLNFIGVSVERICKAFSETDISKFWENSLLQNQPNKRRFHAIISTPLFLMSALSNFYFFGDMEIGNIFMKRFFTGSLFVNATLFMFAYCCCQISIEISNKEEETRRKHISH